MPPEKALVIASLVLVFGSCTGAREAGLTGQPKARPFGQTANGVPVEVYTLRNAHRVEAEISTLGATLVSLKVPDRNGKLDDVVLGFDTVDGYEKGRYFGAIVGRYGNRIAKGRFSLNGVEYTLARNNGENHLHGGVRGFSGVVWAARAKDAGSIELTYLSKDGEEGYPGNLTAKVTYTLNDLNELKIDYSATTDKDTIVNLTNHAYFNLAGQGAGDVLGHRVMIAASRFTPVDAGLIPTGELRSVTGTPFDFREPKTIGERIGAKDPQLAIGRGYDHNYVLDASSGNLERAARVVEPQSGRVMEVLTAEPGMQLYTGNYLDGSLIGKGGKPYGSRYGFCMETQHFPDSPNRPEFPSVVLKPGGRYETTTVYRFSIESAPL
ncbi:MAG: aldose epimerase family protein [Bryobacteraceae bacterium]